MKRLAGIGLGLLTTLAACVNTGGVTAPPVTAPVPAPPSEASAALRSYYSSVQADLLTRGLLRTDGGGPDTPFTPDMLARNFERIAFYDEYGNSGAGLRTLLRSGRHNLRRWSAPCQTKSGVWRRPCRKDQRATDRASSGRLCAPPRRTPPGIQSARPQAAKRTFTCLSWAPTMRATPLDSRLDSAAFPARRPKPVRLFVNPPRHIYCLVITQEDLKQQPKCNTPPPWRLIRAEHPDLSAQILPA